MAFNFSSLNKAAYIALCRIMDLSPLSNKLHLIILLMLILSFHGCAEMSEILVDYLPLPSHLEDKIERNDFFVANEDDVIGRLAVIRLKRAIRCRILRDTSAWGSIQSVQLIQGQIYGCLRPESIFCCL